MDRPKAITATAHKLARLVYLMLTKGQACTKAGGLSVACFELLM